MREGSLPDAEKRGPGQGPIPCPGCRIIFLLRPMSGPERIDMRRCSHVPWDSATALLFGAASAALGRGLLSVTFRAASAAFGVTFFAGSTAGAASHDAGAREKTGYADPCQELLEFLCVHGTPPFPYGLCGRVS